MDRRVGWIYQNYCWRGINESGRSLDGHGYVVVAVVVVVVAAAAVDECVSIATGWYLHP